MTYRYPILLDITRAHVVIIGGGRVAARKASGLIDAGATDLTVVATEFVGDFAPIVLRMQQSYSAEVLSGATLVFAATDREAVNTQVVHDAQARGIWVHRADTDAEPAADFVTPAKFVDGDVLVTVSAGSAALAVAIRDGLRDRFDPRWAAMARAMTVLRPWLRDYAGLTPEQRAFAFRKLATPEALDRLDGGIESLQAWVLASISSGDAKPID